MGNAGPRNGSSGLLPNILLITSDQQHYSTIGAINDRIKTPSLDHICHEGVRFTRAYCANPTCTPSRASIITGMYPSQHGAWTLGTKLFEDVATLGDHLGTAGYYTALVGKAHFQPTASRPGMESIECHPFLRDLEFWRGFQGPWYGFQRIEIARMHAYTHLVGGHYALWMEGCGLKNWRDYFDDWPYDPDSAKAIRLRSARRWSLPEEFHYTRWTGERTCAHIEHAAREGRPFFIWASFHDPHPPYAAPEPWADMYKPADMVPGTLVQDEHNRNAAHFRKTQERDMNYWRRVRKGEAIHGGTCHLRDAEELKKDMACYYGMVSFLDSEIGRILALLEREGIAENTLMVFTTDHGHFLGQHGLVAKAIHHYEDLLRVPLLVRWPGHLPAGSVSDAIQSLVDLAPSFLSAAGLDIPGVMTGVNQVDCWRTGRPLRSGVVIENHHGTSHFHMRTYVNATHKITVYRDGEDGELFDLEKDPGEINNLWHAPESAGLKSRMLHEFLQATLRSEPMRMPRIAGA